MYPRNKKETEVDFTEGVGRTVTDEIRPWKRIRKFLGALGSDKHLDFKDEEELVEVFRRV